MKKLITILIIHFLLLIPNTRDCICQSITWQRLYDGPGNNMDGARSICKADNNNFYIVGYTWITGAQKRIYVLKLNPYGDTIWTRIIGDNSSGGPVALAVVSSLDGGCVFTGHWDSAYTVKLNSTGNIVWIKKYMSGNISLHDIKNTTDGGYIACGSYVDTHDNGYILKIDFYGNLVWQRVYPAVYLNVFNSLELTNDGNYILTGTNLQYSNDNGKGFITKINVNGDIIWNKLFFIDTITSAQKIINIYSGYLVGGNILHRFTLNYSRMFFLKVDFNGDSVYTKIFKTLKNEYLYDIKLYNNMYILTGYLDSGVSNILNGKIKISDSLGAIIREKTLPSPDYIVPYSILPLNNGDIVIAGEAQFTLEYNDLYAIRTDSLLNAPEIIGFKQIGKIIPSDYKLYQNYPNPFNPVTYIKFDIVRNSYVKLVIYDVLGREIKKIFEDNLKAGTYEVTYKAADLASGVYYFSLLTESFIETKKMLLLK